MKNRQKHTLGQIFAEELYRNAPKVSKAQAKKQAHIAQMQSRSSRCTKPRAVLLACILAVLLPTAGFAVKSLFFSSGHGTASNAGLYHPDRRHCTGWPR